MRNATDDEQNIFPPDKVKAFSLELSGGLAADQ